MSEKTKVTDCVCSIHLTRVALDYGCTNILLITRSKFRVQPFGNHSLPPACYSFMPPNLQPPSPTDVDITWIGPHRPSQVANFWSTKSRPARLATLRNARFPRNDPASCTGCGGGATVTQEALALIEEGVKDGRVVMREGVEIGGVDWEEKEGGGAWRADFGGGEIVGSDLIW